MGPIPTKTFDNLGGILTITEKARPPTNLRLVRVVVDLPRRMAEGHQQLNLVAHLQDYIAIVGCFLWEDRRRIVDTSHYHLRKLQRSRMREKKHMSIMKWDRYVTSTIVLRQLWKNTWAPGIATKECGLVWEIIYRAPFF